MICPKCGMQIANENVGCLICNRAGGAANPRAEKPLGRTRFLCSIAPVKAKVFAIISSLVWITCAVLILVMHFDVQETSVEKYPVVSVGIEMLGADAEVNEIKGYIRESVDMAKEFYEENGSELPAELKEPVEAGIAALEACAEDLSPANLSRLLAVAEEIRELDAVKALEEQMQFDGQEEFSQITAALDEASEASSMVVNGVSWGLLVLALLALMFTLFGGVFYLRVMTVFALIFAEIYAGLFGGPVLAAVLAALFVLLFVMQCLVKSCYKQYRRSF